MAQKKDLIAHVKQTLDCTTLAAENAVNAVLNGIEDLTVSKEKLILRGHGIYHVKDRIERKGRNPQTGEPITIDAAKRITFKAGQGFKDKAN